MTRRIVIAPGSDRALFRRFAQRLDQILGFPRTLAESEITRTGPASQSAALPHTETAFTVYVHDDTGAVQLRGALALEVDGHATGLASRFVQHNAVRKRVSEWIADQGWVVRADLPGQESAWTYLDARDGAAGSADGVPIAEGEE
jgi:hypothetical protein